MTPHTTTLTTQPTPITQPGMLYQHYKGGHYKVLYLGRIESTGESAVIYQDLETDQNNIWIRPQAEFEETVVHEGLLRKRFSRME